MSGGYAERDRAVWESIFRDVPADWLTAPPSSFMTRCAAFFRDKGCRRILDLGCGIGRWAVHLGREGIEGVVGLDYALGGCRVARRWALREGLAKSYTAGSASALPWAEEAFDGVVAALVLDGLSRADAALTVSELCRVTRPEAAGFFLFNPVFTAAQRAALAASENPTRGCMHVEYGDAEIEELLAPWRIERTFEGEQGLRAVEAVRP